MQNKTILIADDAELNRDILKFIFDDRSEAIDFAETAFNSADDKNEGVSINLIRVQEEQEGEIDE